MPRTLFISALLLACSNVPVPVPDSPRASALAPSAPSAPPPPARAPASAGARAPRFLCTEVIGLTITAEWYGAGFEQLIDDARFQARTRPHTFVDQWADPAHVAWSEPLTSPCSERSDSPDRVVLFAASWDLQRQDEWIKVLEAFVTTAKRRYPALRELQIFTVLRGPQNQTCGDPKSVVDPMIDAAIAGVASHHPALVHAGPKLEAPDCSVFEKGGPHFTPDGKKLVAQQLAHVL